MKQIIDVFKKELNIDVKSIQYYEGGVSNNNYLVNDKYLFRERKSYVQHFYDTKNEVNVEHFIVDKDITFPCLYITEEGVKITEFVKNAKDLSTYKEIPDDILEKIAHKMKKLHDFKYKCLVDYSIDDHVSYYHENSHVEKLPNHDDVLSKALSIVKNEELYLCHNDLLPGNILVKDNDVYFIDFEYASNNIPTYDIAMFLSKNHISNKSTIDKFLKYYYGKDIPSDIYTQLDAFNNVINLILYYWNMMMFNTLHEDAYLKEANRKKIALSKIK